MCALGLPGPPTVLASRAGEGLQLQGPGGQVVMETKLLAFPGAWSSDKEARLHRAPLPQAPPRPHNLCPGHTTSTEMDDRSSEEQGKQRNQELGNDSLPSTHLTTAMIPGDSYCLKRVGLPQE